MSGSVIGKQLGLGWAGKIARNNFDKVTTRPVLSILDGSGNETMTAIPFGSPVVINTNDTYSLFGQVGSGVSAFTAATFAGVAVAVVKQSFQYNMGANASGGTYIGGQPCDVISQGNVSVFCAEGTPTAGGAVYIGTVAGTYTAVGAFCATSTPASGTAVLLPNCKWQTNKIDANLIAELSIMYSTNV